MTDRTFRPYDPAQRLLVPPSLQDWLPEDHLAYFVAAVVTELERTPILTTYGRVTRGTAPDDPRLLVTILLSAYAVGIPASRQIARELEETVAFRVLAANQRPDFRTISDFRKQHLTARADLLVQVLKLCQRAGLVKRGHIARDGTKVQANASKHKAMSYRRMVTEAAGRQAEVEALLKQAEAADARDDAAYGPDRRNEERPAELARRAQRLQTIRAAKTVLEQEAQADAAGQHAAARRTRRTSRAGADRPSRPGCSLLLRLSATSRIPRVGLCRMPGRRGVFFRGTPVRRWSMRRHRSSSRRTSPMTRMTSNKRSRS